MPTSKNPSTLSWACYDSVARNFGPRYRWLLAGYVLSRETALKLWYNIIGVETDASDLRPSIFVSVGALEEAIWKDLYPRGPPYRIVVHLRDDRGVIISTQGSYKFEGETVPELVEARRESVLRKWLKKNGISEEEYKWEVGLDEFD